MKKVRRKFFKLKVLIKSFIQYFVSFFIRIPNEPSKKVVYVQIERPEIYQRYLYILCKYFLIEQYVVVLKRSIRNIYYINCDIDTSFLLKEPMVYIGKPNTKIEFFEIKEADLRSEYFDFLIDPNSAKHAYHIPIGFHPYISFKDYWKIQPYKEKRKRALFMAGNFKHVYGNTYNEIYFGITNRNHVKSILEINGKIKQIVASDDIDFFEKVLDGSVVLIDRLDGYRIPPKNLFSFLNRFDFFLALPGMFMPLCHNIIEAMSVGTIPFLQEGYATLIRPSLTNGINCITYNGTQDLIERLEFLFALEEESILNLRKGVENFYDENFSPHSVVNYITKGNYSKLYLMAEKHSVDLLAKRMK
jgi:hypothetical protein